jgi:DNA-binding GntR family transcriptional regulator
MEEHRRLIELIEQRDSKAAEQLMEFHILSALEDIVRSRAGSAGEHTHESTLHLKK